MKKFILILFVLALAAACDNGPTDEETTGVGTIRVETFDAPPSADVEKILLTITEVSVHNTDAEWIILAQPNTCVDFLELINGATAALVDTTLEPGQYTQMRLVVADTNEVVVDGEPHYLFVPSGEQSGVKLNLNFTVVAGELMEIMLDFDASKSITWTPKKYLLRPVFKAFKKVLSGTVAGSVKDTTGAGIPNAMIEAVAADDDTTSTLTDSEGTYKLILPEGTYELRASADGYTTADTTYADIEVSAGVDLTGFFFVLQ
ncbi:MAG: DUF4382 domain-containing protein [Spirochaetaceae bacterium]|nr:DUF4382 domain-containing protein [Spirochaetaceae bacterium]